MSGVEQGLGAGEDVSSTAPNPFSLISAFVEGRPMASIATRIGPADHGRAMTLEEFREAEEEEGYCYELAGGVLEVTEVPNDPHGQNISNLEGLFHRHRAAHPETILRIGGGAEFRLWLPGMI